MEHYFKLRKLANYVIFYRNRVKLAHLQASIVDENGNPIDISTYKVDGTNLLIQLKDLKGNLLATVNPTRADLNIAALQSKMNALKAAVQAKKQLDKAEYRCLSLPDICRRLIGF
jgi:hypothetical protein